MQNLERAVLHRMLAAQRIAIVGLSDDPGRASYRVAAYLLSVGKVILPVNPNVATVMGLRAYESLAEIDSPVDLVNVFRRAEFCGAIAREAVEIGAKGLWLQSGIVSADARTIAEAGGLDFLENRCLMVELRHSSGGC